MVAEEFADQAPNLRPETVDTVNYPSRAEAIAAVEAREVYGAVIIDTEVEVIIASAENAAVADKIRALGNRKLLQLARAKGDDVPEVVLTDVAPWPTENPRGSVLASSALPLVISGLALGALAAFRTTSSLLQWLLIAGGSLLTGTAFAAVLGPVLGVLPANLALSSLVIAGLHAACASALLGAHRLAGIFGFSLVGGSIALLGDPLGGMPQPGGSYPEFWANLVHSMPLSADMELLKRIHFFPAAEVSSQWTVLGWWIVAGVAAWFLGVLTRKKEIEQRGKHQAEITSLED